MVTNDSPLRSRSIVPSRLWMPVKTAKVPYALPVSNVLAMYVRPVPSLDQEKLGPSRVHFTVLSMTNLQYRASVELASVFHMAAVAVIESLIGGSVESFEGLTYLLDFGKRWQHRYRSSYATEAGCSAGVLVKEM